MFTIQYFPIMLKKATISLLSFLIISSFVFAGERKEYSKTEYEQKMANIKKNYQVDKIGLNEQHIQTIKSILLKSSFTEKDLKNIHSEYKKNNVIFYPLLMKL